jgi:hypothetical protein
MKKNEFYKKVEETMQSLKIEKKDMYSVKELNLISKTVGVDMLYVMMYLRTGKIW